MKKHLWMPDALGIASEEGFLDIIHRPGKIETFLEKMGLGDNLFFLIGPKGSGKTHLLLCKSYFYHQEDKGYKFNVDSGQLVEYVDFAHTTLNLNDLEKFRDAELWKSIWRLLLLVVALKSANVELPSGLQSQIEELLGSSTEISNMLWNVFNNRKKIQKIVTLSGMLGARISDIQSGVAIFVDNVDQAFEAIISEAIADQGPQNQAKLDAAVDTWINVQMGLLDAIYSLYSRRNHLKIFATIRSEALRIEYPRVQNLEYHAVKLHYTKDQIRTILFNRILIISGKRSLADFLGFDKMPHKFFKNPDGTTHEEDVFDFIYRHTYGRPREIMAIGEKLDDLISGKDYLQWPIERRQQEVHRIVNAEASRFFDRYKTEVIPYFNEEDFAGFINNLRHNVFSKKELPLFDPKTLELYFNLGLLGHTQKQPGGNSMVQVFRNFSQDDFGQKRALPEADYYFIHPTLNGVSIRAKDYPVLDEKHLIGPDLPFYPPPDVVKIDFYKPLKVVGNRWENDYQRQAEPLKKYYDAYFVRLDDVLNKLLALFEQSFQENFSSAFNCFLADACQREFGLDYKRACEEAQKMFRRGFSLQIGGYQAELGFVDDIDHARLRFGHRLFGRMMTLGCCFFTGMRCSEIHAMLLTVEDLTFEEKNHDENKFQYLESSFFIEGLGLYKSKGRTPETLGYIFEYLSPYEQQVLTNWHLEMENQTALLPWILPEHKAWVTDTWIRGIQAALPGSLTGMRGARHVE